MGLVSEMSLLAAIEVLTSLISTVSNKFYEVHFFKIIFFKLCRIELRNFSDMP